MMRRVVAAIVSIVAVTLAGALVSVPASAAEIAQSSVVNADPVNNTPHVLDGQVDSIAQIGNTIVLGGTFTQVSDASGTQTYPRRNVVAFDATTGAISPFDPSPDGSVTAVVAGTDGTSVFLGGSFNTVNGETRRKVAKVNINTGANVSGFRNVAANGIVKDLRLQGNRLWVAGGFTSMTGSTQAQLVTLNATTGVADGYMALPIAGKHNGGTTSVNKIDINADGTKLIGLGNFLTVNGQARRQLFMLDISGASAAVANWQTNFYNASCAGVFETYMRDLDFAPDGSYFVVTTTGGYGGATSPCDTQAKFTTSKTGTGITADWINTTGGDTTYAVEVTGAAIYVGGHFRWANNPFASDRAGAGAVARDGIAALDPVNGMPLSWNPGRTRGVGVFDMLATTTGLWVGSDTDRIGNMEYHGRIAYFPLAGGTSIPATKAPTLPAGIVALGPTAGQSPSSSAVRASEFSGTLVGRTTQATGAINWTGTRAAFMLNGNVYLANTDGSFVRRSFDGTTWGSPVPVNTHDLIVTLSAWRTSTARLTGVFYDNGRIYYTQTNDSALKSRYFTAENDVVGAAEVSQATVSGLNLTLTRSMFLAGNRVFLVQSNGSLVRVDWQNGAFVPGTVTTVSGPTIDGVNWSALASFAYQGPEGAAFNFAPIAKAEVGCLDQSCTFSSAASSDAGGSIASYLWTFGDGATSTEANPTHVYAAAGTYSVKLTVTDNLGLSSSVTLSKQVQFADAPPVSSFTVSCEQRVCAFDGTASSDREGPIAQYSWTFGDGETATGSTASHTFAADGDYTAELTVRDSSGKTTTSSKLVEVEYVFSAPVAAFTVSCDSLTCAFDASGSSDADGPLESYAWEFGDGSTGSGATATHVYDDSGSYEVTLVVTDGQGVQAEATHTAAPVELSEKINFIGAASVNRNSTTHPVAVPAGTQVGDLMVLLFTGNSTTATVAAPAGWTQVAAPAPNGVTGRVWTKVAVAADLGSTVTPTSSAAVKADASLVVYRGVDADQPIAAQSVVSSAATPYSTPQVPAVQNGLLVSYWAVKSNVVNTLTAPDGVNARANSAGTGSGNITALVADSGPLVNGPTGGFTATAGSTGSRALLASLVLQPAGYSAPVAAFTVSCDSLTCSFDASASSDGDGPLAGYAWQFGDGTTGTGVTATHTYAADGPYQVTLEVTDGQGTRAQVTQAASPVEFAAKISFVGAASVNRNSTTHPVVVPVGTQVGDVMVLAFASNSTTATVTAPAGWTEVIAPAANGMTGRVWTKVVATTDLGASVTTTSSAAVKADASLLVYRGVDNAQPIAAQAFAWGTTGPYTTPQVQAVQNGHLVSYWALKGNVDGNTLTAPGGADARTSTTGTGSGNIAALSADAGPFIAGPAGSLTATVGTAGSRAFLVSLVLRPAG